MSKPERLHATGTIEAYAVLAIIHDRTFPTRPIIQPNQMRPELRALLNCPEDEFPYSKAEVENMIETVRWDLAALTGQFPAPFDEGS